MVPGDYYLSRMTKENSGKGFGCGLGRRSSKERGTAGLADAVIRFGWRQEGGEVMPRTGRNRK